MLREQCFLSFLVWKKEKEFLMSVNTGESPLRAVPSWNVDKYLPSSLMEGITLGFTFGTSLPSWLPLYCKVLTPSQEPREQGEKPNSVPVSFNTPNTSAWNNWSSTSHRLSHALLFSLFVLPFLLNSHFISVAYRRLFPPFFFADLRLHVLFLALCWAAWLFYNDVCHSKQCGLVSKLYKKLTSLFHRNWFLSSTIFRRCLSTATTTIWEWEKMETWFVT